MTTQENIILDKSAELWKEFQKLPVYNNDDIDDIRFHVHAIQNLILAREAQRQNEPFKYKA